MAKVRLDHNMISGFDAPKKPIAYYDTLEKGLTLRLSKAGSKTFTYCFSSIKSWVSIIYYMSSKIISKRNWKRELINLDMGNLDLMNLLHFGGHPVKP